MPFLNQQKGENDCRKHFIVNLHKRMLPDPVPDPAGIHRLNTITSWTRIRLSQPGQSGCIKLFLIYKSPQCFLPSFNSIDLLVQEKKRKIYFQDGGHRGHLRFPILTIVAILSTSHPDASYQLSSQLAFRFRRRSKKYIFKMAAMAAILDFQLEQF